MRKRDKEKERKRKREKSKKENNKINPNSYSALLMRDHCYK